VVAPEDSERFVQSLPLERLWGVGPATLKALHAAGIRSIASLAVSSEARLTRLVGSSAGRLIRLARGEDDRPVVPDAAMKSVSHEITFAEDQTDDGVLEGVLLGLAEQVARRARRAEVSGRTIVLKLRLPDFTTLTRSRTLRSATRETGDVFRVAQALMRGIDERRDGVRLLCVGLSGLTDAPQLELDLFAGGETERKEAGEKTRHLHEAEDAIVERFGRTALARAKTLLGRAADDTASMAGRPTLDEDGRARPDAQGAPRPKRQLPK
jgi:DNA polymerase-4